MCTQALHWGALSALTALLRARPQSRSARVGGVAASAAGVGAESVACALSLCEELLFRNPLPASLEAEATELLPQLLAAARGGGGGGGSDEVGEGCHERGLGGVGLPGREAAVGALQHLLGARAARAALRVVGCEQGVAVLVLAMADGGGDGDGGGSSRTLRRRAAGALCNACTELGLLCDAVDAGAVAPLLHMVGDGGGDAGGGGNAGGSAAVAERHAALRLLVAMCDAHAEARDQVRARLPGAAASAVLARVVAAPHAPWVL